MESKELSPIEDKITEQQFHSIWTQAVGMPDYNKRFFQELHSKLLNNGNICDEESRESTFKKQIEELQSQLAEKDKEIEKLKNKVKHKTQC